MNKLFVALVVIFGFAFFGSTVVRAQTAPLSDLDALRYIASHGDLIDVFGADAAKGRSHYQEYGQKEGRKITFDPLTYVASHPDLIGAIGVNEEQATSHYINFGYKEKRTTAGFNGLAYIASFIDLMDAFGVDSVKATKHYVEFGYKEGRRITFNALSYIASHADLITAFGIDEVAGAKHFIQFGFKEGRRVSFDPAVYLLLHGDLQAAFGKDLAAATRHYIQFGFKEGRAAAGPVIQLSASTLGFESQRANSTSAAKVVTVDNTGVSPLTISSVALSGTNAADFTQTHNCASVAGGARCTINVVFSPTSAGAKTASLVLTHNAGSGSSTVALSGTATAGAAVTLKTDLEVLSYIASYADLMQAIGLNIAAGRSHYEDFGAKEGRKITFDALSYIASHGDLIGVFGIDAAAGARHFIEYGYKEGRRVSFDPAVYLSLHADLRSAFGSDTAAATRHYIQFGFKEGRATVGQPLIQLSPFSIDFGSVQQGSGSPVRTILVANVGTAPLTVTQISVGGASAAQFSQTNTCSSVAAGSSCTISVTFTPTSTGSKSGSISISHNASGSPTTVSLTGSGTAAPTPAISVNPTSLSFSQTVNTTSSAQSISVSNTGTATLTISGVTLTGSDANQFAQSNNCTSVAAGSSCTISVTFTPTSTGSKSASISIAHNVSGSPTTYSLVGTGIAVGVANPVISISPTSINFGSQAVSATSTVQIITVRNTGTASLIVSSITSTDTTQFPGSQTCTAASIAPNVTCSISISFKPSSSGVKNATISLIHNASGSPSNISLAGTGVAAGLSMSDLALTLNVLGFSESKATGTVSATGSTSTPVTYSIQTQGAHGVASINSTTGAVTYTVSDLLSSATTTADRVTVKATAGSDTVTANVNISLRYDPLLSNQWHLRNVGQYTFSDIRPTAGFDVNVSSAWAQGYSGSGVKIGVVDTGLEITHEDLSANVDSANSINFFDNGTNLNPSAGYDHGTMVAGIIGAAGFNGKGGRGLAYRAQLRGYNWLASSSEANFARSFGQDERSRGNDIFNGSFGGDESTSGVAIHSSLPSFNNARISVLNDTTLLRGGRGAVVVMSAGNNFEDNGLSGACSNAVSFKVACSLPATASYKQSIVPIIVGALGADGKKASYSNAASSLWVSAPGGEYGRESSFSGVGLVSDAYKPAVVTTATTGCSKYTSSYNALDSRGSNPQATQCQYTATMNGTSSAAPIVSGVTALMLEANPNLGYRDVAHIMAVTARKIDPSFPGVTANLAGAPRQLEQGWTTNAAGYSFSNRYGFGSVDAGAAVSMARTYSSYLPANKLVLASPFLVGSNGSIGRNGTTVPFLINDPITKTERVYLLVDIFMREFDKGARLATCVQIELTSPAGTKSVLLNAANGFQNSRFDSVLLSSNAFYGENPNGTWRMAVFDWCESTPATATQFSLLKPQEFAVTGY